MGAWGTGLFVTFVIAPKVFIIFLFLYGQAGLM